MELHVVTEAGMPTMSRVEADRQFELLTRLKSSQCGWTTSEPCVIINFHKVPRFG